jgi:DNA-binding NtrC family response regulator
MGNQILLVDDEKDVLESFQMILELTGYDVITASDGRQGLELYKKHNPCMVFSDVKMPNMDGYELFSNIIKINSKAKMILITGYESQEKSKTALKNGLLEVIEKPIETHVLDQKIKEHSC